MDLDCFKSLKWFLENDVESLGQYFSVTRDYFGRKEEIDLIEDGRNTVVGNHNKEDYVEKFSFHKMYTNVKE